MQHYGWFGMRLCVTYLISEWIILLLLIIKYVQYRQKEACQMAWQLLTEVYRLPASQLFVTYFGGNEQLGLEPDLECRDIWMQIGYELKFDVDNSEYSSSVFNYKYSMVKSK